MIGDDNVSLSNAEDVLSVNRDVRLDSTLYIRLDCYAKERLISRQAAAIPPELLRYEPEPPSNSQAPPPLLHLTRWEPSIPLFVFLPGEKNRTFLYRSSFVPS